MFHIGLSPPDIALEVVFILGFLGNIQVQGHGMGIVFLLKFPWVGRRQ